MGSRESRVSEVYDVWRAEWMLCSGVISRGSSWADALFNFVLPHVHSIMLFALSIFAWTSAALELASTGSSFSHHVAIRTRDIDRATKFYSLLGLEEEARFLAGTVRLSAEIKFRDDFIFSF